MTKEMNALLDLAARRVKIAERALGAAEAARDQAFRAVQQAKANVEAAKEHATTQRRKVVGNFVGSDAHRIEVETTLTRLTSFRASIVAAKADVVARKKDLASAEVVVTAARTEVVARKRVEERRRAAFLPEMKKARRAAELKADQRLEEERASYG